jgi:hypothetical protein
MKHRIFGVLTMVVAMLFMSSGMHAQVQLVTSVPFNFYVEQQLLVAGTYQISTISDRVELLRNVDTQAGTFLIKAARIEGTPDEGARLVFNKYGSQYFLSQIWDGRSDSGIQLPKSKYEKELMSASNDQSDSRETVVVAMK